MNREVIVPTKDYVEWLTDLKKKLYRKAQVRAAVNVNCETLRFCCSLERNVMFKNVGAKWASGFLKQLGSDLKETFPNGTGYSYSNLKFARLRFVFYYYQLAICQQVVGKLGVFNKNTIGQQPFAELDNDGAKTPRGKQPIGQFEVPFMTSQGV